MKNVQHADLRIFCETRNLQLFTIDDDGMKSEKLFESVSLNSPDAFIVAGWYHMIPKKWRQLAPAYGLHASLLPDYSGGAPLVWAIINGEKEQALHFLNSMTLLTAAQSLGPENSYSAQ